MVLAQNRNKPQWNRIESPELKLHTYGQLIYGKGGKRIQWKKIASLQYVVLGKLNSSMEKNKIRTLSNTRNKLKTKLKT